MTADAIVVEGLGKRYRLGADAKATNIAEVFMPWWRQSTRTKHFWALKNISFSIAEGESVGIIGSNGAGKSTLLKILSRITAPTTGRVRVRGRVGTLLEVGTGFHPELTGRDNIFLSGTILGLLPADVRRYMNEIIDFAGVAEFIDTPVKRYSSGMQVKLAFAVALYLEPEILIVDEVLAVGDLGFQRKSLDRLNEVTGRNGRTVLFVSHSLEAVNKTCERTMVLENGEIKFDGATEEAVNFYRASVRPASGEVANRNAKNRINRANGAVWFEKAEAFNATGSETWKFSSGETARFRFSYEVRAPIPNLIFLFRLLLDRSVFSQRDENIVTNIYEVISRTALEPGFRGVIDLTLPALKLRSGEFSPYVYLGDLDDSTAYDVIDSNVDLPKIVVEADDRNRYNRTGLVSLDYRVEASRVRSNHE